MSERMTSEAMLTELSAIRDQFLMYERSHRAKPNGEGVAKADVNLNMADRCLVLMRNLEQALRASQTPPHARKDELEIAKHVLGLIFPKANDADFAMFVERHGVHIAAIIRADRAIAEKPAATVTPLTEEELAHVKMCKQFAGIYISPLVAIIERLTAQENERG